MAHLINSTSDIIAFLTKNPGFLGSMMGDGCIEHRIKKKNPKWLFVFVSRKQKKT